jgi:hypothetical protein
MKRKKRFLVLALCGTSATFGCGSKQPPQTPPSNAPSPAANGVAVGGAATGKTPVVNNTNPPSAAGDAGDESDGGQSAPGSDGVPSPPTFGGSIPSNGPQTTGQAGPPPDASGGAPAATVKSKPGSRPLGAGGGPPPSLPGPGGSFPGAAPGNFSGFPPSNQGPPPGDNPFQDPSNQIPTLLSLDERAVRAFQAGNVTRAYGLYQAHLLSLPKNERDEEMGLVRWDKKRIAPCLGYSFAVGLVLNNTSRQDSLKPIGTKLDALRGGPGGSSGASGGGFGLGEGFAGGVNPSGAQQARTAKELNDAAGKYATMFVDAFGKAHSDGKWSEAFRSVELGTPANTPTGSAGPTGPGGFGGFGKPGANGLPGGVPNAGGAGGLEDGLGQFRFRFPQDGLAPDGIGLGINQGPGFGMGPGVGAPNATRALELDPAMAKDIQLARNSIPLGAGLTYIGKGDSIGELAKLATEQHYDALIVFEVDVSFLRVNNTIKNDCRIRVLNLRADKDSKDKAIVSTLLNNRDVANEKNPDAKVETAVENLLKKMHEAYPLDDLPNFKAESIQGRRLKDLVQDKVRSKLDLLCEVELYAARGLIDDKLKLAAFERIAGPDGKDLATAPPEERIPILEKMIQRQYD